MNINININKILPICYLLLLLPLPFLFPKDVTSFINIGLSLFYFASLNWAVSRSSENTYKEKLFALFSFLTLLNFIAMSLFAFQRSEGTGFIALGLMMLIPIPVFVSLIFGFLSLFKTSKKFFYTFLLLIPITLTIIYFASDKNSTLFGLFKFIYSIFLTVIYFPAELLNIHL